jgi:hypothetical protein
MKKQDGYRVFTLEECLLKPQLILYHTREMVGDWVKDSPENIPRSIVGLPDGELILPGPTQQQKHYRTYGTISSFWPFKLDGRTLEAHMSVLTIELGNGTQKMFNGLVYFVRDHQGNPINRLMNIDFYLGLSN